VAQRFAKALLNDAKTVRLDSHLIALYMLRIQPCQQTTTP
jgi:hypothetical protein